MAQNDSAPVIPGQAYILTAASLSATQPTLANLATFVASIASPPSGFVNLGHTDLDNVLTFNQDGGETEVKGSWQVSSLRETTTSDPVDSFQVSSIQLLDNDVLSLYYGGGDASVADEFSIPDSPAATERACVIVFIDGAVIVGAYFPKVSISRGDAIDVTTDDFMKLPLKFTVLQKSGAKKMKWLHTTLGA